MSICLTKKFVFLNINYHYFNRVNNNKNMERNFTFYTRYVISFRNNLKICAFLYNNVFYFLKDVLNDKCFCVLDACVLQILMAQMEHFYSDFLTTINMTHALISSMWHVLQKNNLLRSESSESCNCYTKLLRFIINMLRKCSENKLDIIDDIEWQDLFKKKKTFYLLKKINYKHHVCQVKYNKQNIKEQTEIYSEKLDRNFWFEMKKVQYKVLRQGIRFLCHLAICDPDFVIRSSDIEDSFHLFIRNITFFEDLILHENERKYYNAFHNKCIICFSCKYHFYLCFRRSIRSYKNYLYR